MSIKTLSNRCTRVLYGRRFLPIVLGSKIVVSTDQEHAPGALIFHKRFWKLYNRLARNCHASRCITMCIIIALLFVPILTHCRSRSSLQRWRMLRLTGLLLTNEELYFRCSSSDPRCMKYCLKIARVLKV